MNKLVLEDNWLILVTPRPHRLVHDCAGLRVAFPDRQGQWTCARCFMSLSKAIGFIANLDGCKLADHVTDGMLEQWRKEKEGEEND